MPELLDILKQYWGYESFRPLQEDIIRSVIDGQDTLALMPTGGGKSICFQVPGLYLDGICLVISPLIALMKDQVHNLEQRGIPARAVYSGMPYAEIDRTFDNCIYGQIRFLYLSPERLTTELARERLQRMRVSLIAVDEAHCISQWGYDFRPSYLEIAKIRELLPQTPVLALTATAIPAVVDDIQRQLEFRAPHLLQTSFARSNLAYVVLREEGKQEKLYDILRKVPGPGIVYVRNRRQTKEIARLLQRKGISADFYHAGLSPQERSDKQDAWIQNQTRIIVSTNAFGMGIDKPDARVVVHYELPDSLEAYFQEAGRAGRDGRKAYAVLLYNASDRQRLERQYAQSFPPIKEIRRVYRALGSYLQLAVGAGQGQNFDFDILRFTKTYELNMMTTLHCLRLLEQAGWIALTDAVFQPASLHIKVSKDQMYDYQLRNPKFDKILKTILRTYQGAFHHYINLREAQLARFLDMSPEDLQKSLHLMQKDGIVNYHPQSEQPQLIFTEARVEADHLTIDQELYNFRKNRYLERINKAISYAETPVCRSQQLLRYFGETEAAPCGICDVCLGRHRRELSDADFNKLKEKIQRVLAREPLPLAEVVASFSPKWEQRVIQTLEYLLDEGAIRQNEDKLEWSDRAR